MKKQELMESENLDLKNRLGGLEREAQALKNEKTRLEGLVKASQDNPAVIDWRPRVTKTDLTNIRNWDNLSIET